MITYHNTVASGVIEVKLNGRRVGRLVRLDQDQGWQYRTNRRPEKRGEIFPTIEECKRSVEGR